MKKYSNPRPYLSAKIQRLIKTEAGHTCAIKECSEHTYLEIHHINQNREDNDSENLILLCVKHHRMADNNVIDRKSLYEYKKMLKSTDIQEFQRKINELEEKIKKLEIDKEQEEINKVLVEGIKLGHKLRGTEEGNKTADNIFTIIKNYGNRMNVDSIDLLVCRSDLYSRTGIVGLEILYDYHFDYTMSLNLKEYFKRKDLIQIAYYCAFRNKYPNEKGINILSRALDFQYEDLKIDNEVDEYYLFSKYINRGPSALLDYLVKV